MKKALLVGMLGVALSSITLSVMGAVITGSIYGPAQFAQLDVTNSSIPSGVFPKFTTSNGTTIRWSGDLTMNVQNSNYYVTYKGGATSNAKSACQFKFAYDPSSDRILITANSIGTYATCSTNNAQVSNGGNVTLTVNMTS